MNFASVCTGLIGCVVISATSLYSALRFGALPWPLFLAALVSFAALKRPHTPPDFTAINFAHTMMTAGSMIAGGIAFTLPAVYLLQPPVSLAGWQIFCVISISTTLGLICSWYLRPIFLNQFALPYPIGTSTAQMLLTCVQKGTHILFLIVSSCAVALFTFVRDFLHKIPITLFSGYFTASPMAMGLGYLLKKSGLVWGFSALVTRFGLYPILMHLQIVQASTSLATWTKSLSMGMMISCSLMQLILSLWHSHRTISGVLTHKSQGLALGQWLVLTCIGLVCVGGLTWCSPLSFGQSVAIVPIVLVLTFLSCTLCGRTGINPLGSLGMMGFLLGTLVVSFSHLQAIVFILIGSVATGLCGDLMNDFQVGKLMGTPAKLMFLGEVLGAFLGVAISVGLFFAFKAACGGQFNTELFAMPQAVTLKAMVSGDLHQHVFIAGLLMGLVVAFIPHGFMIILGIYMNIGLSMTVALGSALYCCTPARYHKQSSLIASGCLVGEGIVGSCQALWELFVLKFRF